MSQIHVDTDAMQAMADALGRYSDEVSSHVRQLEPELVALPAYWQGTAAQRAHDRLVEVLSFGLAVTEKANYLRSHLLKAKHAFEQAGLEGLNNL